MLDVQELKRAKFDRQSILITNAADIDAAIQNTAISVIRSAAGKLELDELQSSRESMNQEIKERLGKASEVWGVEVTRTEIRDVIVDE